MRFDWLDIIEGPFRAFARLTNKQQWTLIGLLWALAVVLMLLDGIWGLLF